MVQPSLADLEAQRSRLHAEIAEIGDFRRGSVTENYRRCGKANCACAAPEHPGHGPRYLWTRSVPGGGTKGRQLAGSEVDKVRREVAKFQEFVAVTQQITEVNEAICEARPVSALAASEPASLTGTGAEKGGSSPRSTRSSPPR